MTENMKNGIPDTKKLEDQVIGWPRKGFRSFDGGTVVWFPRTRRLSGECRFRYVLEIEDKNMLPLAQPLVIK